MAQVWSRDAGPESPDRAARGTSALLAGAFHGVTSALLHPLIIVAYFISRLSDTPRDIALVAVIATATWYVPQLLTTALAAHYRRAYPVVVAAALVRVTAVGLLATAVLRADGTDAGLARRVLLSYVAYQLASATLAPATLDLLTRSALRRLSVLFRDRFIVASAAAVVTGIVIAGALRADAPAFPRAFGWLFLLAGMAAAAESWFLLRLRERDSSPLLSSERAGSISPRRLAEAWAHRGFRHFLGFRVLLALAAIADPFLIVHGMREIQQPERFLGIYLIVFTLGKVFGTAAAVDLGILGATRTIFQVAALLRFAVPLLALLIPFLATSGATDRATAAWLFGVVFLGIGLVVAAHGGATLPAVTAMVPPGARGAAIAWLNVALALCALSPLLGSRIVEQSETAAAFIVAAAVGFVAVLSSGTLMQARPRRARRKPVRRPRRMSTRRTVASRR